MKNTGKTSEEIFEDAFKPLGKKAFVWRIPDAAEIYGRTEGGKFNRSMPSDYILTLEGQGNIYAEVKSTQNLTSYPFSSLKKGQNAMAAMIIAAGGPYNIYIHRLTTDQWYRIPYSLVKKTKDEGASSIKWEHLKEYPWNPSTPISM